MLKVKAHVSAFEVRYGLTFFRSGWVVNHSCKYDIGWGFYCEIHHLRSLFYRVVSVGGYVNTIIRHTLANIFEEFEKHSRWELFYMQVEALLIISFICLVFYFAWSAYDAY